MSGPRFAHSATRLANGNVLLVGGQSGTAKSTTLKSAELFDMGWLNWRAAGNLMNRARRYHTATLLASGKVLIAAGENSLGAENTAEIYDPVIETWTMTGALTLPRYSHTATLLNDGRVLVSGGYEDGFLPTAHVEIYDPASGAWSEAAPMLAKRVFHSASLLPDGRVLIAGGYDGWQTRSDAEIYDPTIQPDNSLGATSQVGPMSAPRDSHLALTLQNGEILVLGGIDGQVCTATSEIFHWLYGWRATELPMSQARYLHAGAVLPNGDVFVTGGWTGSVTTSSAVYIP